MLRVSTSLLGNNLRNYIQNNLQRAAKYQEQSSTGKTINRPSDSPSQISYLMSVNATLISNEQYSRNIKDGLAYLNQSDSALDTMGKLLQDAKVEANKGANGTLTPEDRNAIAEQIDRQIDAMVDMANSALGGKYLFAGRKNGQPPFYRDPDSGEIYYRGDTNLVSREIIFGYSYEVVAAGVADNYITGTVDLSQGKVLKAEDMTFKVALDENNVKEIDLSGYISPGFRKFDDIKNAMQQALDDNFGTQTIAVDDDGKGHIVLQANNDATAFKVLSSDPLDSTKQGHTTFFGGERSVINGVFGKLASSTNPANQLDDPMNPGQKMTKVVGGPFEVLSKLVTNLRNNDSQAVTDSLKDLENAHDDMLKQRVGVGARTRHLEAVQDQLDDQEIKLKSILVDVQGADITKLTIEVAQNQLVHQASLMTASNLLNTSLLQYLK
ncbi:flagellar hook-associated protein 3 [Desulforamulus reducens MI-1]|uniref:Flagellar hook-associated protein 3 n=1 Tax=Desulforamulus reducens (strain ATCC BAA-1160 / DSM 100696 / MI-1) TaxID=349161 RepID=A4J792_DESRM|nr:flagellar hook-associated protein FlgL [Desulforamulus reducens]ABO50945.1 flagellar hook-associated protein 3 [Desulforamulus reducens MI-1]